MSRSLTVALLMTCLLVLGGCAGDTQTPHAGRSEERKVRQLEITPDAYAYLGDAVTPGLPALVLIRWEMSGCNAFDRRTGQRVSAGSTPEDFTIRRSGRRIWAEVKAQDVVQECDSIVANDQFSVIPSPFATQLALASHACNGGIAKCELKHLPPAVVANWVCSIGTLDDQSGLALHPGRSTPSCRQARDARKAMGPVVAL